MCSNFYTLKLIITHFKPFIVKLQNKEMCFQQKQLHTTAETVESEHSLNCKMQKSESTNMDASNHRDWVRSYTHSFSLWCRAHHDSCNATQVCWRGRWAVVLGLQDVTITCLEARQQHFGRAPEKILPGLRHCAAQLDSKTGCGKAAPGEIPTGVKSSRATWLLIDGVYESRWSQCFILVKLSDSRNRNGNICKLTFSGCGSLMKICSLSLYIIGQLKDSLSVLYSFEPKKVIAKLWCVYLQSRTSADVFKEGQKWPVLTRAVFKQPYQQWAEWRF